MSAAGRHFGVRPRLLWLRLPPASSLARRLRKQCGQSCISAGARCAPRRWTVVFRCADRVHREPRTGLLRRKSGVEVSIAERGSHLARADAEASVEALFADCDARRQQLGQQTWQGQPEEGKVRSHSLVMLEHDQQARARRTCGSRHNQARSTCPRRSARRTSYGRRLQYAPCLGYRAPP